MKGTGAKRNVCPGSCVSTGAKFPVAPVESAPMGITNGMQCTHTAYIYIYTEQVYLDRLNPFDAFIYEQNICIGCGIKCSCALHRLIRVT